MIRIQKMVHVLGVVVGYAVGVATLVAGIYLKKPAIIVWGVVFLAGSTIAVASGARARPGGSLSPVRGEATYTEIPDIPLYIIMALVVVGMVVTFLVPPW